MTKPKKPNENLVQTLDDGRVLVSKVSMAVKRKKGKPFDFYAPSWDSLRLHRYLRKTGLSRNRSFGLINDITGLQTKALEKLENRFYRNNNSESIPPEYEIEAGDEKSEIIFILHSLRKWGWYEKAEEIGITDDLHKLINH